VRNKFAKQFNNTDTRKERFCWEI